MSLIQAILLGLLQGVAEFLPISSSGHLRIAQSLFGLSGVPLLFDVALHMATLLAVIIYFRKKICSLIVSFAHLFVGKKRTSPESADLRYIIAIILSTLVTGVLGVLVSAFIGGISVKIIAALFIVTALLLISSSFVEKRRASSGAVPSQSSPTWIQALIIGFAQGVGTLPGISRSGATISASLYCGIPRDVAGEYSFIVSIPAILGAFVLEVKDLGAVSHTLGAASVAAGCLAAFASGYLSLALLMRIIKRGRLEYFACYLIPAGILGIIFL